MKTKFGKKNLFPLVKSPWPACPLPVTSCPESSAWPKGWEEARENEEVKKYPWAVRCEEFWPISTDMLVAFVGVTKMMNLKLRQCLGYRVFRMQRSGACGTCPGHGGLETSCPWGGARAPVLGAQGSRWEKEGAGLHTGTYPACQVVW